MWNIVGHEAGLQTLARALASESPAHAWLFSGPEGLGKRTVAMAFAAALNCVSEDKPCGKCKSCRDTLAGRHPDVEVIAPGGLCDEPEHRDHAESRDLRICQVRRLERVLSLSPYAGGRRVAIIDAADSLRAEAANAFLKTLEEPAGDTVIILLAEREDRLPETVPSRCQRVAFKPIDRQTIHRALIERGAAEADALAMGAFARGRTGLAFRALEDPSLLSERDEMLDNALRLARAGRFERFTWARSTESRAQARGAEARERNLRELEVWEGWWRDVLQAGAGKSEGLLNQDREALLLKEGRMYEVNEVVRFLQTLVETKQHLYENVDPQLALEVLTMGLPRRTVAAGAV